MYTYLCGPGYRASLFFYGEVEHIRLEPAPTAWSSAYFVLQNEEYSSQVQAHENWRTSVPHSESPQLLGEVEERVSVCLGKIVEMIDDQKNTTCIFIIDNEDNALSWRFSWILLSSALPDAGHQYWQPRLSPSPHSPKQAMSMGEVPTVTGLCHSVWPMRQIQQRKWEASSPPSLTHLIYKMEHVCNATHLPWSRYKRWSGLGPALNCAQMFWDLEISPPSSGPQLLH